MNVMKKSLALLLVFALTLSCFPLGAVTAFAAENEETQPPTEVPETNPTEVTETQPTETEEAPAEETTAETEPVEETAPAEDEISRGPMMFSASPASDDSGSSGSEVGDGGDGSGNAAGEGSSTPSFPVRCTAPLLRTAPRPAVPSTSGQRNPRRS